MGQLITSKERHEGASVERIKIEWFVEFHSRRQPLGTSQSLVFGLRFKFSRAELTVGADLRKDQLISQGITPATGHTHDHY